MSWFSTTANARLPTDDDPIERAHELMAAGRPQEAAHSLRARIKGGRGGLLARLALVRALRQAGDLSGALSAAREANALNPNIGEAVLALGEILSALDHLPAAIAEFQRALRLDPNSAAARFALGCAWSEAGEAEKALDEFVRLPPDSVPELAEKIFLATAMRDRPRSDPGYVRHLFDQFSADYDARMRDHLAYRAPEILRQLAGLVMPGANGLEALDLGCGTGLAGQTFASMVRAIDGIDLSPAMIEKARSLALYRRLEVADIETRLHVDDTSYDLVIAADTLVYLGDLTTTFSGVARRLRPGGMFLFTVEESGQVDFELGPKRRWRHSKTYIRSAAAGAGMEMAGLVACTPRSEGGVPVEGLAVALTRPE